MVAARSAAEVAAPRFSILVITRGPSLHVARFLRSIGRLHGIERAEVLVGLNGSARSEAIERLARRFLPSVPLEVISFSQAERGRARNYLLTNAKAPLVLFADDDIEVPPDLLARFDAAMSDPDIAVAGGPNLTPKRSTTFEELAGRVLASALGTGPVRHRYRTEPPGRLTDRNMSLACLLVRRSVVADRGFDDSLKSAEENELVARIAHASWRMVYRPDLAVYHHRRDTLGRYFRQMLQYGFGRGQMLVRAFSWDQVPFAVPSVLLAAFPAAVIVVPMVAGAAAAAYLFIVAAGAVGLAGVRTAPTAAALLAATHFGYALGLIAGVAYDIGRWTARALRASAA
jgi:cellulose synthase/poly-beta-1,6-N-acetylglucosamine synthase-like glycosyltransferase